MIIGKDDYNHNSSYYINYFLIRFVSIFYLVHTFPFGSLVDQFLKLVLLLSSYIFYRRTGI